jgi:ubiquinone/menaquinone biosynthesis C-methylase UbiE
VLVPLSRRVGMQGSVTGVDLSQANVKVARDYASRAGLANVEVIQADFLKTNLPPASFDLVHVRFMFTPLGQEKGLLQEMLDLT